MAVVGVILAGGEGRRLGGAKAMALLAGQPLAVHVARALTAALPAGSEVVAVAKADTALPPGLTRWDEPAQPRHPLTGIRTALRRAGGAAVLCVAVDLPLMTPPILRQLIDAARQRGQTPSSQGVVPPGAVVRPLHPAARQRGQTPSSQGEVPPGAVGRPPDPEARQRGQTPSSRVVVAGVGGRVEPACALWTPGALEGLDAAAPDARLLDVIAALHPLVVDVADPGDAFLNVNTPADLRRAEVALTRR